MPLSTTTTNKDDDTKLEPNNEKLDSLSYSEDGDDDDEDGLMEFSDDIHAKQEFLNLYGSLRSNFGFLSGGGGSELEDALEEMDFIKEKEKQLQIKTKDDTIDDILQRIHDIEIHTRQKGMKEWNFTFGLLNCLIIAYVFGAFPGYFWILYMIESFFWITLKFIKMYNAKPLCEVFYYFDFCWMMNFTGLTLFTIFTFAGTWISHDLRREFFYASFGIATGPVFMAAMTLPFVAFLFHDTNTMTNLIIHILPSMLNYILKWQPSKMKDTFPNLFDLEYLIGDSDGNGADENIPFWDSTGGMSTTSVASNAIIIYMSWWIPYVIWMLCIGLKMPAKLPNKSAPPKYDTVFHSLWRDGPCVLVGKLVWKRSPTLSKEQSSKNNFEIRDFMLYIIGHLLACILLGINVLARLCYTNQVVHGLLIFLAVSICARRGASRYTYYATAMYSKTIQKEFQKESKKKKQRKSVIIDNKKKE